MSENAENVDKSTNLDENLSAVASDGTNEQTDHANVLEENTAEKLAVVSEAKKCVCKHNKENKSQEKMSSEEKNPIPKLEVETEVVQEESEKTMDRSMEMSLEEGELTDVLNQPEAEETVSQVEQKDGETAVEVITTHEENADKTELTSTVEESDEAAAAKESQPEAELLGLNQPGLPSVADPRKLDCGESEGVKDKAKLPHFSLPDPKVYEQIKYNIDKRASRKLSAEEIEIERVQMNPKSAITGYPTLADVRHLLRDFDVLPSAQAIVAGASIKTISEDMSGTSSAMTPPIPGIFSVRSESDTATRKVSNTKEETVSKKDETGRPAAILQIERLPENIEEIISPDLASGVQGYRAPTVEKPSDSLNQRSSSMEVSNEELETEQHTSEIYRPREESSQPINPSYSISGSGEVFYTTGRDGRAIIYKIASSYEELDRQDSGSSQPADEQNTLQPKITTFKYHDPKTSVKGKFKATSSHKHADPYSPYKIPQDHRRKSGTPSPQQSPRVVNPYELPAGPSHSPRPGPSHSLTAPLQYDMPPSPQYGRPSPKHVTSQEKSKRHSDIIDLTTMEYEEAADTQSLFRDILMSHSKYDANIPGLSVPTKSSCQLKDRENTDGMHFATEWYSNEGSSRETDRETDHSFMLSGTESSESIDMSVIAAISGEFSDTPDMEIMQSYVEAARREEEYYANLKRQQDEKILRQIEELESCQLITLKDDFEEPKIVGKSFDKVQKEKMKESEVPKIPAISEETDDVDYLDNIQEPEFLKDTEELETSKILDDRQNWEQIEDLNYLDNIPEPEGFKEIPESWEELYEPQPMEEQPEHEKEKIDSKELLLVETSERETTVLVDNPQVDEIAEASKMEEEAAVAKEGSSSPEPSDKK